MGRLAQPQQLIVGDNSPEQRDRRHDSVEEPVAGAHPRQPGLDSDRFAQVEPRRSPLGTAGSHGLACFIEVVPADNPERSMLLGTRGGDQPFAQRTAKPRDRSRDPHEIERQKVEFGYRLKNRSLARTGTITRDRRANETGA